MAGQPADRLLMAGESLEARRQLAEQRIPPARRGEGDLDGAHRLGKAPVDHRALMTAKRPDAVTGPEEREVRAHHPVEQAAQVRLDPPLGWRLEVVGVGVVERAAAEQDPRPVAQINVAERALLEPYPAQLAFIEPGQREERVVLVIGRGILGADGQQQEWFHPITLNRLRSCRSQLPERADPARQMTGTVQLRAPRPRHRRQHLPGAQGRADHPRHHRQRPRPRYACPLQRPFQHAPSRRAQRRHFPAVHPSQRRHPPVLDRPHNDREPGDPDGRSPRDRALTWSGQRPALPGRNLNDEKGPVVLGPKGVESGPS